MYKLVCKFLQIWQTLSRTCTTSKNLCRLDLEKYFEETKKNYCAFLENLLYGNFQKINCNGFKNIDSFRCE